MGFNHRPINIQMSYLLFTLYHLM